MTINQKIIPVFFLVIGLVFGFTGGKMFSGKGTAEGDATTKARLVEVGVLPPQPSEVKQFSGMIKTIDGNKITVALSYPRDPFGDPALDERIVTISDETMITRMFYKEPAIFQKEMTEYENKMKALKPGATENLTNLPYAPQPFEKKTSDLASLEVGQQVSITTLDNAKDQKSFIAATIDITGTNTPPPPPPASTPSNTVSTIPPPASAPSTGAGYGTPPPAPTTTNVP